MISAVIPAFNEEKTIAQAVTALTGHPEIGEIIVVDDGSSDTTSLRAKEAGAHVITLSQNSGKAQAMTTGVRAARHDIILFMDADVEGYTHEKISKIVEPVLQGTHDMFVGVRARSIVLFNRYFHFFPILGGERALTKSLWYKVPLHFKSRFKIEIALNHAAKQTSRGMGFTLIEDVTHFTKEQKYGLFAGLWRRLSMIWDVLNISATLYILQPLLKIPQRIFLHHKKF